jgi:CMP-N-acetylneuraminic acid synthetase
MAASPRILGVVPARGGSKGIPGKNTRPLGGVPLIAYTIRAARACGLISKVVVTTDAPAIRDLALEYGADAPFLRPAELATDTALAVPTIQHAVREMERLESCSYDYVAMLQPTTPFRTSEDLDEALGRLVSSGADGIISVVNVGNWHPMKMKVFRGDQLVDYEKPPVENPPRQTLPPVYMVNGALYATRRDVLVHRGSFQGDRCLGYEMPAERSVNIDSELDFVLAEYVLRTRQPAAEPMRAEPTIR